MQPDEELVEKILQEVMRIQRVYAWDQDLPKNQRQAKVRDATERILSKGLGE